MSFVATSLVAATAAFIACAMPASAAISNTGKCGDIYSASGTQRVQACTYFDWSGYQGGYPYRYHAVGSLYSYSSAGSSKLTVRSVRVQQYQYAGGGSYGDVGTTNPSYPKSGTTSVTVTMYDRSRTNGAKGGCPVFRAVVDYRVDFTSGGYKTGTVYGPAWSGSCLT